ncbi:MAG: SpoIVB peptidase [Roseburia sp.]|nr:SpoIVB peptidase [Roseburia sp.]
MAELCNENENEKIREAPVKEDELIKKRACREAAGIISHYKRSMRKYRIYRCCLYVALLFGCTAFAAAGYYMIDRNIPSTIYVRADKEQILHLGVPATGDIVSVGSQGKSNVPREAVTVNLNGPVVMRTGGQEEYSMQVRLFGFLPFKRVGIQVVEEQELIPVGAPIGIYVKTEGVLVVGIGEFESNRGYECSPAKYILRSGDYIQKLNGVKISEKEELIQRIEDCGGAKVILTIGRGKEEFDVELQPVQNTAGEYKIGVWVRDNTQGVGTLTYIDGEGNFGALGHGINDVDTSMLMEMDDGTLYETEIVSVRKGETGNPGELTGMIVYTNEHILGDITENNIRGIFGQCNDKAMKLVSEEPLPIGFRQEIEKGYAQILCTVEKEPCLYEVEITSVHLNHDNVNRGIELTVKDERLLELTGGIVQGMSGSPIIQNGRIIGAVTHVLVDDPTKGYGIFIEEMLEGNR